MADRGVRGTMTAPTSLDDESYLDAVQALRGFAMGPLLDRARTSAAALAPDAGVDRVGALPSVAVRDRVLRTSQEMLWRRTAQTYDRARAELSERLAAAAPDDAGLAMPGYLREHHLQAGGYHGDELAGFIYHYGTKVFWLGSNDLDQGKEAIVDTLPVPGDGPVGRVVELACAVGQSTTALKRRFPDAEVWGIDIAAPMVRYARLRAQRSGSDVRFAQQAAEDLDFDDASVDLVYASLLFHEIPGEVRLRVLDEVRRVLRPGGLFVINDLNPQTLDGDAWSRYDRWWDTVHNAEPYELDFLGGDFTGALEARFARVEFTGDGYAGRWVVTR